MREVKASDGPTIPVRMNKRTTVTTLRQMNGDHLLGLRDVRRSENGAYVRCYNEAAEDNKRMQVNVFFKDQRWQLEKIKRGQRQFYKRLVKVHRDKRKCQREEHKRKQEEIRKDLQNIRLRRLIKRVVNRFRENVKRKKAERTRKRFAIAGGMRSYTGDGVNRHGVFGVKSQAASTDSVTRMVKLAAKKKSLQREGIIPTEAPVSVKSLKTPNTPHPGNIVGSGRSEKQEKQSVHAVTANDKSESNTTQTSLKMNSTNVEKHLNTKGVSKVGNIQLKGEHSETKGDPSDEGRSGGGPPPADGRSGGGPPPADGHSGGGPPPPDGRSGGGPPPADGHPGGHPGGVPPPADGRSGGGPPPADGRSGGVPPPGDGRSGGGPPPVDGHSGVGSPSAGGGPPPVDGRSGGDPPRVDGRSGGDPPPVEGHSGGASQPVDEDFGGASPPVRYGGMDLSSSQTRQNVKGSPLSVKKQSGGTSVNKGTGGISPSPRGRSRLTEENLAVHQLSQQEDKRAPEEWHKSVQHRTPVKTTVLQVTKSQAPKSTVRIAPHSSLTNLIAISEVPRLEPKDQNSNQTEEIKHANKLGELHIPRRATLKPPPKAFLLKIDEVDAVKDANTSLEESIQREQIVPLSRIIRLERKAEKAERLRELNEELVPHYKRNQKGELQCQMVPFIRASFIPPSNKIRYLQEKLKKEEKLSMARQRVRIRNFVHHCPVAENVPVRVFQTAKSDPSPITADVNTALNQASLATLMFKVYHKELPPEGVDPNSVEALKKCRYIRSFDIAKTRKVREDVFRKPFTSWDNPTMRMTEQEKRHQLLLQRQRAVNR